MSPHLQQKPGTREECDHFAASLRKWRSAHGLMPRDAATRFGVADATWRRWEARQRFPAPGTLRLLAEFIGVPICCFFYQEPASCPHCPGKHPSH